MDNIDQRTQFLEAVCGDMPAGYCPVLWLKVPDGASMTRPFFSVDEGLRYIEDHAEAADVYIHVALAAGTDRGALASGKRITNTTARGLIGFGADIDFGKPGYPRTVDEAAKLANAMPYKPTALIATGRGTHGWWLFREPWIFESDEERVFADALTRAWHLRLHALAQKVSCRIDDTSDLARVLRVPGTTNRKQPDKPLPVEIISADGPRLNHTDIMDLPELSAYWSEAFAKAQPEEPAEEAVFARKSTRYGIAAVNAEADALARQTEPGRNTRLNQAAFALAQLAAAGQLTQADAWKELRKACKTNGLGESAAGKREVEATLRSGWNAGLKHPRRPAEDTEHAEHAEHAEETVTAEEIYEAQSAASPFRTASVDELFDRLGEIKWEWPSFVPRGFITLLVGRPDAGKSTLALEMARRFTTGIPWPDGQSAPEPAPVLWLDAEGSVQGTVARAKAWGVPMRIVDEPMDFVFKEPGGIARMVATAQTEGARIVVIDALASVHVKDENSAEMRHVMTDLANAANGAGLTVLLIHHLRKRGQMEGPDPDLDRVRGSSAITALCRSVIACWQPLQDKPTRNVRVIKSNFAQPPEQLGFEWVKGEDGKTVDRVVWCAPVEVAPIATAKDEASEWLRSALQQGKRPRGEILAAAEGEGYSERTIERARKLLGVVVLKDYDQERHLPYSWWGLPG